ncbi:arylsulfatase A-like [Amphiura filiformis]|uniref:arylsulfatase A-like n=1 Tax=Amphiura filiformis TaxID=82378 RepID=UPI003B21E735
MQILSDYHKIVVVVWVLFNALLVAGRRQGAPNVIILLADDLGYGDLSSYGHPSSYTPILDRMAAKGLKFTDFYTASPICSPARASILTGRQPPRTGVYPGVLHPDSYGGLPLSEITIAEMLKPAGYSTSYVGKWHLGVGKDNRFMPTNQGFDDYFGIPYSHDMCPCTKCFYPADDCLYNCNTKLGQCALMEGTTIREQPTDLRTLSDKMSAHTRNWIANTAIQRKPFFLIYSFYQPHNPLYAGHRFRNATSRGPYGDMLAEMDWMIGEMLQELRDQDIEDNTFIFFTSDNGPALRFGTRGGSAGLLKCGKGTTYEGGQRVPAIAYWPGTIQPGQVTSEIASTLDLLPTIANIAQVPLPSVVLDGVDMGTILFQQGQSLNNSFFYYGVTIKPDMGLFAVRYKNYKAHYFTMGNGNSGSAYHDVDCRTDTKQTTHFHAVVYNLQTDPSELYPLSRSDNMDIFKELYDMKVRYEASMTWRNSQITLGRSVDLHPCINPGCEPFPACCRQDWRAPVFDAQKSAQPVLLTIPGKKKRNKKKKKCLVYADQQEL